MTKRTREQKIIADLRKQIALRDGVLKPEVAPRVEMSSAPKFSLPKVVTTEPSTAVTTPSYSYLKRDLLRLSLVVAVAIGIEIIGTYLVSQGLLKSWGIS